MEAVKFLDEEAGLIGGLAIPYGGPANGKDLQGEYFSKDTDFALDFYAQRPIMLDHGLGKKLGPERLGYQTKVEVTDAGLWAEGILDRSHRYWNVMRDLVQKGALNFSSSALTHLVVKEANGHIKRWPWSELSLTPEPANPFAIAALKSIVGEIDPMPDLSMAKFDLLTQRIASLEKAAVAEGSEGESATKAAFTDAVLERFVRIESMITDMNPSQLKDTVGRIEEMFYNLSGRVNDIEEGKKAGVMKALAEEEAEKVSAHNGAEIAYYQSLVEA